MKSISSNHRNRNVNFFIIDLICVELFLLVAYYVRHHDFKMYQNSLYRNLAIVMIFIHFFVVITQNSYLDIFRRGYFREFVAVFKYGIMMFSCIIIYMFGNHTASQYSRISLFVMALLIIFGLYPIRVLYKTWLKKSAKINKNMPQLVVVSRHEDVEEILDKLTGSAYKSYEIQGIVLTDRFAKEGEEILGLPILCNMHEVYEYARKNIVDQVLLHVSPQEREEITNKFLTMGIVVHISMEHIIHFPNASINQVNEMTVLTTSINSMNDVHIFLKRSFDIVSALMGIMITILLTIILGPLIFIQSPGPIFFRQERVGKNGRIFKIYKFRSMYLDAEERKKELMQHNQMQGHMFKMDNDPRIFPVGKFIRKASLDEFPQFINILLGDMSLVGTRPPTVDEYERYELHHKSRLSIKPGLTGMWQTNGRNSITDFEEVVRLDNEYIKNWSIGLDLKIILKTVLVVLGMKGVM